MATYFTARKAEPIFREYKRLTLEHWRAQNQLKPLMTVEAKQKEIGQIQKLRDQLIHLFPDANSYAQRLGILQITLHSYPAPLIGGPIIPVNVLYAAFDQDQGHATLPRQDIMDTIELCLATATAAKKRLFWTQLLNPFWWIAEVIAYMLRFPFFVLRRAGIPASAEESVWGHAVKVLFFVVLLLIALHWGIKLEPKDILQMFK